MLGKEILFEKGNQLINDKNNLAKSIAVYIRNSIEDIHVDYLSDDDMRRLNSLIRNAIFSFLIDYRYENVNINNTELRTYACEYIQKNTIDHFRALRISDKVIAEFYVIIKDCIADTFLDIEKGATMLAGYSMIYVPSYWEDCVYNTSISNINNPFREIL